MRTPDAYLQLEHQLSSTMQQLTIWDEKLRDVRPHPSQIFGDMWLPKLLSNQTVALSDYAESLNRRLAPFNIKMRDPQPQAARLQVDGQTVYAMLVKALRDAGVYLPQPRQLAQLLPVIRELVGEVNSYCSYDPDEPVVSSSFLDVYMRGVKMRYVHAFDTLDGFDETGAEKAWLKAQEKMKALCVDLPPGFREAMAFLRAGQEGNAYIQSVIKATRRYEPGPVAP